MSPRDGHPDWNDLAALAEGRTPDGAEDLRRHLAGCRSCAAAYGEAVRLRTQLLRAPESLTVPADLAAATTGPRASSPRRRPRLVGAVAAVAALALLMIAIRPDSTPETRPASAIRLALLEQAPAGMVLPGLTPAPGSERTVYRDAGAHDVSAELTGLALRHERDHDADSAFWLGAGYLAAGRLEAATAHVREVRRRHPDDARLQILDAVASYRRSELGRAETLLREILVRSPENAAARFDLALVLQESGRPDEARRVLDAASWRPGTWLAARAAALRDTLR